MDRIGVRELRQNASRYLKRVLQGESFEVTDRGRLVARLVPAEGDGEWERLVASGRVRLGKGDLSEIKPEPLPDGATPPSVVLERMREEER